jgi:hypothetical protein
MNSCAAGPSIAAGRASATSATPACSKSAELSWSRTSARSADQPVQLRTPLNPVGGRALRYAGAPRRPPPDLLNATKSDLSKWWTHDFPRERAANTRYLAFSLFGNCANR